MIKFYFKEHNVRGLTKFIEYPSVLVTKLVSIDLFCDGVSKH